MPTIAGKVESKSRKGNSIKVDGNWYGVFAAADLDHVNWKDDVKFSYEVKGDYRNIKGPVVTTAGGASAPSGGGKVVNGNLGVELGHASNLAMRMMEQAGTAPVGTTDYYKQFAEYTVDMYKVMQGLRAKVSAPDFSSDTTKSVKPDIVPIPAEEDDIF